MSNLQRLFLFDVQLVVYALDARDCLGELLNFALLFVTSYRTAQRHDTVPGDYFDVVSGGGQRLVPYQSATHGRHQLTVGLAIGLFLWSLGRVAFVALIDRRVVGIARLRRRRRRGRPSWLISGKGATPAKYSYQAYCLCQSAHQVSPVG